MNNISSYNCLSLQRASRVPRGFSLLELMVAVAVFTIVAGAGFSLAIQHEPIEQRELLLSGMNTGMRSAMGQIQTDLANAGSGNFGNSANRASFPVGAVIINTVPATACNTGAPGFTYGATCFDKLNIIESDVTSLGTGFSPLALHPVVNANPTTGSVLLSPQTGDTATTDAAYFKTGDEILFASGTQATTFSAAVLTANGAVNGTSVQLTFSPVSSSTGQCSSCSTHDPLGITAYATTELAKGASFGTGDWVVRLDGITYSVNTSNATGPGSPSDPQLVRTQRGVTSVVADQVIGFKVGAALWNSATGTDTDYYYDSSKYTVDNSPGDDQYDWALVRSVRVCLIGRTTPGAGGTIAGYANPFDLGPYEIEALSTTVNPRNLSMTDQ